MTFIGSVLLAIVVLASGAWLFWKWNTRKTRVAINAPLPEDFPSDRFDHSTFENLLREFSIAGKIDYESWHGNSMGRRRLESYLVAVARFGPSTSPARFTDENDTLAYWMYAYNAMVIHAILDRWPLKSVTDVKAPVELIKGLGFFYNLEFQADGRWMTLYDLEHNHVIDSGDPRVHFVLNCGSEACPALKPELPAGPDLDDYLDRATRDFVCDPANVEIDDDSGVVRLSAIFKWYEKEFVSDLKRRSLPSTRGVLDYVASVAPPELAVQLGRQDYQTEFRDYDWAVNATVNANE